MREEQLRSCLHTSWAGCSMHMLDVIDSTNDECKRLAEAGALHGMLVISEQQTAGRGRRGRNWESQKGEGIFMTLLLRPNIEPGNASMLTLVMAMAVREALQTVTDIDTHIKWPNDIVCDGKKLVGILTEMSAQPDGIRYIVIGVGINVHNISFSADVDKVATSVYQQSGKRICREQLIAEVMRQFERYYDIYLQTQDMQNLTDEYNRHLINCGRRVRVLDPREEYEGTALGINASGELLVQTEMEISRVSSGEVSVRGIYGYV